MFAVRRTKFFLWFWSVVNRLLGKWGGGGGGGVRDLEALSLNFPLPVH